MDSITVLSPHFDDGVLSCGGSIWEAATAGQAVRVVTLFAGPAPTPVPPFARVQHRMWGEPPLPIALRQAEDRAAHARLGCLDVCYLDVPDAVYRLDASGAPRYGSEVAIFGAIHPEEAEEPRGLAALVRPLLGQGLVLAPLGAGGHVDHQLGHAVGRRLEAEGFDVAYYEELPYIERADVRQQVARRVAGWRVERVPLSESAVHAKVSAMAYYHTQVPVLYGSREEMARRIRAVAAAVAGGRGYAEQRWRRENG